ncbi:hypothetical protein ACQ4PT_047261 [Festuca glaucescens]
MAVLLSSFSPSQASRAIATGAATTSFTPQDPQSWATGAATTSFAATCAATASSSPLDPRLRIYRSRSPSQDLRCPISVTISFAGPSQGEERQGPGLSGDESFDKCCIFGNEVQLTCNQRNQLCSIVEELPMPEMKHYVCTLINNNVIPGEGKMIQMDQVNCQFCHQPTANCKYSNRHATSFKIIMQQDYDHFALPTEDDSEDEIADEDAEGMEYEEEAGDGIFQVTVADPDGNQKPFHLMNGPIYVPEEIRGTLYKTVFTDMHAVGEADMTEIVWEMYKDASNDVDSIDELQYIVHKVDAVDAKSKRLALPENLVHGYNYPKRGIARFSTRLMSEGIAGHYFIQTGVLGRLVVWLNGEDMDNFCEANSIV